MNPLWIAAIVLLIALAAEMLHVRRILRASRLVFAVEANRNLLLTLIGIAALRSVAVAGFVWGAAVLWTIPPRAVAAHDLPDSEVDPDTLRRLVILLDVSPSMSIRDMAGGTQSRARRASEVVMDALSRIDLQRVRCSVVAFYTDAKPVVIETVDPNVIRNVVEGLPLTGAFEPGKTDIIGGITHAFALASQWKPKSTSVLMISDGDAVAFQGMPKPPASVDRILIAGVGDTQRGTFIDDHVSRQDASALQQVATRLGGTYFNVTAANLPPDTFSHWTGTIPMEDHTPGGLREWALCAVAISAFVLLIIPFLQQLLDQLMHQQSRWFGWRGWRCVQG